MPIQKTYRARAIDGVFGYSKNNTEEIVIRYQVSADGPDAGAVFAGYAFFNTRENAERAIATLRRNGVVGDDITALEGLGSIEVEIVVEDEEHQGKVRSKVAWVNEIGGGGALLAKRMDDGQKMAFAQRMKGLAATIEPSKQAATLGSHPSDWDTV